MKRSLFIAIILSAYIFVTSFCINPKPHLIVGNWELVETLKSHRLFVRQGIEFEIARVTFSSDEITSTFYLKRKEKMKEEELRMGFNIFEPFDDFKNPVLLMKNICDDKTRIVFSIMKLTKETLRLQFEVKDSEGVSLKETILDFERTAGPPQNMP